MTRDQLKAYCLQLLDDVTQPGSVEGGYFNDNFMYPALNRGQEEVQKQLIMSGELYYLKEVQTVTVQGQADYILPEDWLKMNTLYVVLSGSQPNQSIQQIVPMTLNQQYIFGPQQSTPTNYIIKKERFSLYPTPDQSGQTLVLGYSYKIADLTSDSQTPDVPEEYQKMISVYAALEGKVKDNTDPSNLLVMKNDFETRMKQMAMDRQYQQPRTVVVTENANWIGF